jgi:hypothetical protein
MSNNLLNKNITEQMQEEAEIQIRDKKKSLTITQLSILLKL